MYVGTPPCGHTCLKIAFVLLGSFWLECPAIPGIRDRHAPMWQYWLLTIWRLVFPLRDGEILRFSGYREYPCACALFPPYTHQRGRLTRCPSGNCGGLHPGGVLQFNSIPRADFRVNENTYLANPQANWYDQCTKDLGTAAKCMYV